MFCFHVLEYVFTSRMLPRSDGSGNLGTGANDIILKNVCEKKNLEISFKKLNGNSSDSIVATHSNILPWNHLDQLKSLMKDIFLPVGYPHSVSSDYLEYQLWDTCQAFCSSVSGTLSMSAVMEGVGVGSSTATPVSAAIAWIMKDGTGMLGSILFAWFEGSKLDSDCKKWRLFADVINDMAMCLELYIPHVIHYSVYLLCLSTILKALVGVAGSATRAALTCHQAVQGNMADVSAKDSSQEIFVNLCAYMFGIVLLKNVTEADKIWAVMCTFILLHLFSNYKAVSCLKINVYNGERFRLGLRSFLATSDVPTVEQVNRNENVILGRGTSDRDVFGFDVHLGVSLDEAVLRHTYTADDLSFLVVMFQSKNYLVMPCLEKGGIFVSFRKCYTDLDVLKGYFHAALAAAALSLMTKRNVLPVVKRRRNNSPIFRLEKVLKEYNFSKKGGIHKNSSLPVVALLSCEEVVEREFTTFCKLSCERGWMLNKNQILVDDWRADWKYVEENRRVQVDERSLKNSPMQPQENRPVIPQKTRQNPRQYVNYSGIKKL